MSTYETALLLHIVGALLYFSGIALAGVAFFAARRREQPGEVATVLALARTGVLVAGVGTALLLGCAFWLVDLSGTIGFGDAWISAALGLFGGSLLLGGVAGQAPKRARKLAARLAAENGTRTPELNRLLDHGPLLILNIAAGLASVAVLVLMVWQPGS